uniref:TIL domain-containing protein n=1 Tax=Brugia malayi TaxID=6279 RepID=A0A8L7YLU3_BRUMA
MILPSMHNETLLSLENGTQQRDQSQISLNDQSLDLLSRQNIAVEKKCMKNEVWTNCTGCELSCDEDEFLQCQNICYKPGCECPAILGFRRASNGNLLKECSITEEFKECGSVCEETCDDFGQPIVCSKQCLAGCFCKEGYIREKKGGCCILPELCDTKKRSRICGPNQEYRKCGTACPKTCNGLPENCTQHCVDGCFCKEGYVLDLDKCIPEDSCKESRECPENEVYRKCGSPCQEICGKQKETNCNACIEGCFCKLGYVMEEKVGACIKPEHCMPPKYMKCPGNETFTYCGGCEGTCKMQFVKCPTECGSPRCECLAMKNYVRNEFGICVHINDCIN